MHLVQPIEKKKHGILAFIIVHDEGVVQEVNAQLLAEVHALPSFLAVELFHHAGSTLRRTVDCFTFGGTLQLLHDQEEQVEADYRRVREIETQGLFICAPPA